MTVATGVGETSVDLSERAQKILEMAVGVCLLLDLPVFYLKTLEWSDKTASLRGGGGQIVPSDQCFILPAGDVILPKHMKEKLSVDEWKPLIASSLIYERKLLPMLRGKVLKLIVVPTATSTVVAGVFLALTRSFWAALPFPTGLVVFAVPPSIVLFLGLGRFTPYQKSARLQADMQATRLVGREFFLEVLRKIDGLGMEDIEERKRKNSEGSSSEFPSLAERLENLLGGVS